MDRAIQLYPFSYEVTMDNVKMNRKKLQEAINFAIEQMVGKSTTIKIFNELINIAVIKEPSETLSDDEVTS